MIEVDHIVTSRQGGASIAAQSLHLALIENGVNSRINLRSVDEFSETIPAERALKLDLESKWKSKLLTLIQAKIVQTKSELVTTFGVDVFSKKASISPTSIIHVHSMYNFITSETIRQWVSQGRNLVLQLHDQRFLTGGCHHDLGCEEFKRECINCPQARTPFRPFVKLEKRQINWILNQERVHVIAPSKFLFEKAKEIISDKQIHVIPNILENTNLVGDNERKVIRRGLGFNSSDFVVGFCAANIDSPYKNFMYFRDLAKELIGIWENKLPNLKFLIVGEGRQEFKNAAAVRVSSSRKKEVLAYISAMDLILVPSRMDNAPNVVIESLLEGTPVLATPVGGIPDLLDHLEGDFFLTGNVKLDARKVIKLIGTNQRRTIQVKSNLKFNKQKTINSYLELYKFIATGGISKKS